LADQSLDCAATLARRYASFPALSTSRSVCSQHLDRMNIERERGTTVTPTESDWRAGRRTCYVLHLTC
jgi:translation elongation factor EF-4